MTVLDRPLAPAWGDPATGYYSLTVPQGVCTFPVRAAQHERVYRHIIADHHQTQGFALPPFRCILLVDDDEDTPDVGAYCTAALDTLGYNCSVWDTAVDGTPAGRQCVAALRPPPCARIRRYLQAGHRVAHRLWRADLPERLGSVLAYVVSPFLQYREEGRRGPRVTDRPQHLGSDVTLLPAAVLQDADERLDGRPVGRRDFQSREGGMSEERRIDNARAIVLAHLWRGSAAVCRGFKLISLYSGGGVAQAAMPDGENDVARGPWVAWTIHTSGGVFSSGTGQATPGGAALNLYSVLGDTCVLAVGAGGNVTAQRAAGALTYDVTLLCPWQ